MPDRRSRIEQIETDDRERRARDFKDENPPVVQTHEGQDPRDEVYKGKPAKEALEHLPEAEDYEPPYEAEGGEERDEPFGEEEREAS